MAIGYELSVLRLDRIDRNLDHIYRDILPVLCRLLHGSGVFLKSYSSLFHFPFSLFCILTDKVYLHKTLGVLAVARFIQSLRSSHDN